jgi:hypothetical protein
MVIAGLNTDPKQYGEAIVNALVAEYQATRVASSLAIAGRLSNIEQRIQAILNPNRRFYRRPSPMAVATAIFCAAVVLPTALVLTARGGSSDSESAGPATPKQNAAATQQNVASSRESGESATTPSASQAPPAGQQMMELPVRVVDADGNPVANARITPWALRSSQGHGPWQDDDKRAGVGPKEVVTGVDGGAVVLYPRDRSVEEQVRTIAVSLYVDHPAFAFINFDIDVPPESKEPYEIKLTP